MAASGLSRGVQLGRSCLRWVPLPCYFANSLGTRAGVGWVVGVALLPSVTTAYTDGSTRQGL